MNRAPEHNSHEACLRKSLSTARTLRRNRQGIKKELEALCNTLLADKTNVHMASSQA